jgi:hypothetical protein
MTDPELLEQQAYEDDEHDEEYDDMIAQIPMGTEAAKMMTTFGDGPRPNPGALQAALLGTRRALQMAIMDARKVRRRLQQDFKKAQNSVTQHSSKRRGRPKNSAINALTTGTTKSTTVGTPNQAPGTRYYQRAEGIDPNMLYRALADGTDRLSYQHKCGFHLEELTHLFPEEMRAYQRFSQMKEEYSESKGQDKPQQIASVVDEGSTTTPLSPKDGGEKEALQDDDNLDDQPDGGHLRERAAQFDFRTDRMNSQWYLKYAKVRQGSFLPNSLRVRRTPTEVEWDKLRKKRGRHAAGSWENMSGRSIRFLHWLGFDPPNLYPPDDEATNALAFLAYDRLGRIVEKAVFLRNVERIQKERNENIFDESTSMPLWELPAGQQLTQEDVEKALQDPDIKPATVYGTGDSTGPSSIQLYFGPGWEERLELEMEE